MRAKLRRALHWLWLCLQIYGAETIPNASAYREIIYRECEREYAEHSRG